MAIAQTKTDESAFADPDRFDITRSPNPYLGFGLAAALITAMLRELLSRAPDICAAAEPDYLLSSFISGIKDLPCEFV